MLIKHKWVDECTNELLIDAELDCKHRKQQGGSPRCEIESSRKCRYIAEVSFIPSDATLRKR